MNCPNCGGAMNHHADKLIYLEEEERTSEIVAEFYTCHECGANASLVPELRGPER